MDPIARLAAAAREAAGWLGARPWAAAAAVFLAAFGALLPFHAAHPLLYDTDSFYHLAVARQVGERGLLGPPPAVRYSALTAHGFADNAFLFHLLLAPFAGGEDPLGGARIALAALDALLLATIAGLACRAIGGWGLLAPLWIGIGSLEVAWRLVRLRPELLSLLLLLLALAACGLRRYRLLGAICALYALAYVAWHALLGLLLGLFLFRGLARRQWDWALALYPVLGTALGLLLHPSGAAGLLLWKLAAIDVLRLHGALDAGTELGPATTAVLLLANLGFWAVGAVIWWSRRASGDGAGMVASRSSIDLQDAFGSAAIAFGLLYLVMSRFAIYAFPLAGLWLLFHLARRGEHLGSRVRLPVRGALPTPLALAIAVLLAAPGTVQELGRFDQRTRLGPGDARLADRVAFGEALPPGARVAAPWAESAMYLLWAPQGRYLNVLDPAAMAVPFPRAYAVQRALFSGEEPDVPLAAVAELDSDFVAWSLPGAPPRLLSRLAGDPRARALHRGFQALYALRPAAPGTFWLDWRARPAEPQPQAAAGTLDWPRYPRHPQPTGRAIEGYVDARRVAARGCVVFTRPAARRDDGAVWELAAAGPTRVWWAGKELLTVGGAPGAVLGEGVTLRLPAAAEVPAAGPPLVTVLTCPDGAGRAGFYWVRRG